MAMIQKLGDGQHICSDCWSKEFSKPEPENNWQAGECDFCKDNNKEKTDKLQEIADTAYTLYGEETGKSRDEIYWQCEAYFQNTDLTEDEIEKELVELFESDSFADDEEIEDGIDLSSPEFAHLAEIKPFWEEPQE